jgi:hypothetical protein
MQQQFQGEDQNLGDFGEDDGMGMEIEDNHNFI